MIGVAWKMVAYAAILLGAAAVPGLVGVAIAAVGTLALGWAIFRANALSAWRAAAEGYRAQVDEMKPRLENAEKLAVSLQEQITELERRPDLRQLLAAVESLGADVRTTFAEIRDHFEGGVPGGP